MTRRPTLCRVPGCFNTIRPSMLMCLPHWKRVPEDLRRAVYRTWRARKAFGHPPALVDAHLEACAAALVALIHPEHQPALIEATRALRPDKGAR
jgi:hypothetical protein